MRSLIQQIDVARAAGHATLYLLPEGTDEVVAREALGAPDAAIIQAGDSIGEILQACAERGVQSVILVGRVETLLTIAAGIMEADHRFADARLDTVAAVAAAEGALGPLVARLLDLSTAEAAIPLLAEAGLSRVWDALADRAALRATRYAALPVACALIGHADAILGRSVDLRRRAPQSARPEEDLGQYLVVGVGPGPDKFLTPAAWQAIRAAEVLVAEKQHLERFAPPSAAQLPFEGEINATALCEHRGKRIVVLVDDDPVCDGVLPTLRRELPDLPWQVVPGICAMQMALARVGEAWDTVVFAPIRSSKVSDLVATAWIHPKVLAVTDAGALAAALVEAGMQERLVVMERLCYPDERITAGTAEDIAAGTFAAEAVVYIERIA